MQPLLVLYQLVLDMSLQSPGLMHLLLRAAQLLLVLSQ